MSTRARRSTRTTAAPPSTPSSLKRRASTATVKEKEPVGKGKEEEKKVGKPHSPSSLHSRLLKQRKIVEELGDAPLVEALGKILASSSSSHDSSDDSLPFLYLANSLGSTSRSHLCSLQGKENESAPLSAVGIVEQLSSQLAAMSVKEEEDSVLPQHLTFDDHEKMMAALADFPWSVCCIGTDMDGEHILLSRYEGGQEAEFLTRRVRMKEMRSEKMAPSYFLSGEGKEKKRTCVEEGQWGFGELMRTLHRGTEITPKVPGKATKKVCLVFF